MCGIIGFIGKEKCTADVESLLTIALSNIHRGDDGVGVIFKSKDKWNVVKKHNQLEELNKKTLDKSRSMKEERIGDIQITEYDDDKYMKEQIRFEREMDKFYTTKSRKIFLHHRKGTIGADELKNLHPVLVNDKFYMHNGTVFGLEPMKKWFELNTDIKFNTDIDTEVIATIYQQLQKKLNNDNKKVYESMLKFFPSGWGVLIEFTEDGSVNLIKDNSRTLWAYCNDETGLLLVSEPVADCDNFNKILLLSNGIYKINSKIKGKDYTKECKQALEWWKESVESVKYDELKKCETCQDIKQVACTYFCTGHPDDSIRNEICFECLLLGKSKSGATAEQQQWIRSSYADLIADYEEVEYDD